MQSSWRGKQFRAERAAVSLPASIVTISAYQYPVLADISQTGAKLKGDRLPPKGTTALLRIGEIEILCRVVWVSEDQCGIRFEETVSPAAIKRIQLQGTVALATVGTAAPDVADDGFARP